MRGIIKNRDEICTTPQRRAVADMLEAGIRAALPEHALPSALDYDAEAGILTVAGVTYVIPGVRIFVIGGGKASGAMAEALESILGPGRIAAGIVNCRAGDWTTEKIALKEAGSPIPDERGVGGVRQMLELKDRYAIGHDDVVICLISGGGSALMPLPAGGVSLDDVRAVTELLLQSGADIGQINAVRKHLSAVKGGRLGRHFSPTLVISLLISDVVGDDPSVIASGPTVADESTFAEALKVLEQHGLLSRVPRSVVGRLKRGAEGELEETPKHLANCHNYIIGSLRVALETMKDRAEEMGYRPTIATSRQTGDPAAAAHQMAGRIREGRYGDHDVILAGGETTPSVPKDHGKGGRNQHYAAALMLAMEDYSTRWTAASVDTDGADFDADAAGAVVDDDSLARARAESLDVRSALDRCDSATLLTKIGGCRIVTGETGTNVCDVMVHVVG